MNISVIKNLVAQILGITTQRPFPKFINHVTLPKGHRDDVSAAKSLSSQEEILRQQAAQNDRRKVVFLSDAFARYIEPEVEQAALDILSKCGYAVHVLPVIGAGASFLSKGFVDDAQRHATRLLDLLNQADPAREAPIVGIEPPEIYTLKHDYLDLLPQRAEEIHQRIQQVWLLDEFLLRSDEFNLLRVVTMAEIDKLENKTATNNEEIAHLHPIRAASPPGRDGQAQVPVSPLTRNDILFHPHCHQRAEGLSPDGLPTGTNATLELLRSCGYDVELIDSGCCGMAGTFGYEAEHYDLSMKIGELRLFPVLRESGVGGREVEIVSTGAACRMQIQQGTGLRAVHPILLVQKRLEGIIAAGTQP
jgi:Fe-S oxidoreductase